jgi:signal transduction histidine kinase/CRP-like cAMP-binding protein
MVPIAILKRFPIFEGLTDSQLERIAALCQEEVYESGVEIFREGEEAKYLYLLLVGTAALEMRIQAWPQEHPKRTVIDVITRGEPFGWSALVEPHILTLSAKTLEQSRVIVIKGADLYRLFERDQQMGYLVMERLTSVVGGRLRETRKKCTQMLKEAEVARAYAPEESTLVQGVQDFIRFRWVAVVGVIVIALLTQAVFRIDLPSLPIFAVAGGIALYNLLFWLYARGLVGEEAFSLATKARRLAYAQSITDLVAVTILIHYTGGIENPFIFYYVFHVIIASVLLSSRVAYSLATFAFLLLSSLAGLEYLGFLPHVHLEGFVSPYLYQQDSFVLAVLLAFATTLYVSCYMTVNISGELRRRRGEVVALKDRLLTEARELEEANRELVRLDRLKTYFLAIASHDLKTPLAAVESYLQVILGGFVGEITEQQRHMMERSSLRIKELIGMINRFLDLTHIERGEIVQKMEMTSLDEVLDRSVEEMQVLASERGQTLTVEKPPSLPLIYASPSHLHQVLTNLLSNAVKFTPEGGSITLGMEEVGDNIQVTVTDTGVGIDPEDMPRIFEDFYRGRSVGGVGTGLGLSIAKRIVEAHRGKIWAQSPYTEGQPGSRFTFVIPKDSRG